MSSKAPKIYTLNKGEWSEAYCLVRAIADGKLELVDANMLPQQDLIKVIGGKISTTHAKEDYEYRISGNDLKFSAPSGELPHLSLDNFRKLHPIILHILHHILTTKEKTFTIHEVQEAFPNVGIKLKSNSLNKADLTFRIMDDQSLIAKQGGEQLGFSVKSFLAGSPTLVNASGATNFLYTTSINAQNISAYKGLKAKSLLRKLSEEKQLVQYTRMDSSVYQKNLMLIDTNMPQIIAEALKIYFSGKMNMISEITATLKASNPLKLLDVSLYENKIKDFLFNSALGMFPDKEWDGLRSVDGGCIVISPNGALGTFYIVRKLYLEAFRDYLFQACFLDTASTSRHKFGTLIADTQIGTCFLKLNLQVRVKAPKA